MRKFKKQIYTETVAIFNAESDRYPAHVEKILKNKEGDIIKSSAFYTDLNGTKYFHREWDKHIQRKFESVKGVKIEFIKDGGVAANKYRSINMNYFEG